jgi:GDPmannose 4,6-dehydratase
VIATGETHAVSEFVEEAFAYIDLDWRDHVVVDAAYFRPAEVDFLLGDASRAREKLGWAPETTMKQLVKIMVDSELERLQEGEPRGA